MTTAIDPLDERLDQYRAILNDATFPTVRAWKQTHPARKVVGMFPVYTPYEIPHAAGMLLVGLFGAGATIEIDHADSRIQSFVCSIARSTLELGLTQRLKDFDAMVFTSICDVARNLSGVWQANFPHQLVEYIHFLQNLSSTAAAEHYAQELRRMLGRLKKLGGVKVTDEQLRRSIAAYNRHRTLCAELYALRQTAP